jgi:mannose-6-phosphate isomerase
MLYPLKFKPILKNKIWGGKKLNTLLNKTEASDKCGESWEISGIHNEISVVVNGKLKGNNLQELIEVYMGDLVGDKVYEKFGIEFPLLIKFIDANDVLSIQVHPDNNLAKERHNAYGKTEMWYIIEAEKGSELISGFNKKVSKKEYLENLNNNTLKNILNHEKVNKDDVFYIPSGRVHAIGSGILLAEIQQTSDVTYRIYDWNRKDEDGNLRELHTDMAVDAIDYNFYDSYKTDYCIKNGKTAKIINCEYFNTNIIDFSKSIEKDYNLIDSFVIYMCIEGSFSINYSNSNIKVDKGETVESILIW